MERIASAVGLPRSSTYHLLRAMITEGFVVHLPEEKRYGLGVAAFVAVAGFGWQQWQAFQQVKEFEELDTQILSSDLPIDAYLDRGFQNWIKASFER